MMVETKLALVVVVAAVLVITSMYFHAPIDTRACLIDERGDGTLVIATDPRYRVCHPGEADSQPINLVVWP